jgi:hypothetical protein
VQRGAIDLAIDGHAYNSQIAAGAQNADGDLSAIGDEQLFKHFAADEKPSF